MRVGFFGVRGSCPCGVLGGSARRLAAARRLEEVTVAAEGTTGSV